MPTFEELKAFSHLLERNKVKNLQVIGYPAQSDTLFNRFYQGLLEGEFKNDAEAKHALYGTSRNKDAAYAKLKSRLHVRMQNSLFVIDSNEPSFNRIEKAFYTCNRNLITVKILLGKYARKAAIPIAKRTLRWAIKYEFTEVILELAKILRLHYGAILGDKEKFRKYNDIVIKHKNIYLVEIKAEEYYTRLVTNFVNSSSTKLEFLDLAKNYCKDLKKSLIEHHSYRLNLHAYLIFIMRYEIENNHEKVIKISKEALCYFNGKKHLASNTAIVNFKLRMIISFIQLKKYSEAESTAQSCIKLLPEGSNNWFFTLNFFIILYFHSNQFQEAYAIYRKAVDNSNYPLQYQNISENWRIHEAFINYFILIGKIKPDAHRQGKKFRLSKFLNEVPIFSKDKRGTNITILILQILFLLQQRKYGEIIDKVESLKAYSNRYLRRDDTFRSNCFIKMLLQIPANNFHKAAVQRKVKRYWQNLRSVPINIANQSSEIEIVPYEALWLFILESLDHKFH